MKSLTLSTPRRLAAAAAFATAGAAALLPGAALAQSAPMPAVSDAWKFRAIVYAYLPDIGGTTTFPKSSGGTSAKVDSNTILDSLNFAFMGTFEATKGRYGILADVLYMDVSGSSSRTRDITIDGHPLPVGVTGDLDLGIRGTVFELAGTYNALSEPSKDVTVLAGARMLDVRQTLTVKLSADIGDGGTPGQSRQVSVHPTYWDAIVGAKGQFRFGERNEWLVPWYVDVGAGQSKFTWQAIAGVGYAFSWGQVLAAWRYLDYDFKSSSDLQSLYFNGPMIGAAFSW